MMTGRAPASEDFGKESEERLQIEAAQKDRRQFAELYEQNFERVYAFVARRVGDRHEAEDLTADVFHRALANLRSFEWRGVPFAAWLFRIAANAIADRAQRAAKQREISSVEEAEETRFEDIEQRARLFRLVGRLPADQRRVIVLRFGEQRTIREIAGELGRSEGAVKQLQFRGLQNLKTRMGENNG